ncbi:MAG: ribonuclease HII [Candidatus Aenigmatarchaeota archaeon]
MPRGSVIGPLVICGVLATDEQEKKLKKIGVKDSKLLTPKKREELSKKIEEIVTHTIILRIPAHRIDSSRKNGINLNQLEAIKMAEIINIGNPNKVFLDAPSYNTEKFKNYLLTMLENKNIEIIAENYADKKYPIVSAASIMAKVDRDEQIKKLEEEIGEPIGVGYPHDELTIKHIEKIVKEGKKIPLYVRTTWDTTKQIIKKNQQKGLSGFIKKIKN